MRGDTNGHHTVFGGGSYLTVWVDLDTGPAARARILKPDGTLAPTAIELGAWQDAAVAWNGSAFVVVGRPAGAPGTIVAQRISPSGLLVDSSPVPIVSDSARKEWVGVSSSGDGGAVIVWRHLGGPFEDTAELRAATFNGVVTSTPGGVVIARPLVTDSTRTSGFRLTAPAVVASSSTRAVLTYTARNGSDDNVYERALNPTTLAVGPESPVTMGFGSRFVVGRAFDGTFHHVVVGDGASWLGQRAWHHRFSDDGGLASGASLIAETTNSRVSVATGAGKILHAYTRYGIRYLITDASREFDPTSWRMLHQGVDFQTAPAIASNGKEYLAVFEDRRAALGSDILGIRIASPAIVGADLIPIARAAGDQVRPTVAYDGTAFVVAWEDRSTGRVRARRVSTSASTTTMSDPVDVSATSTTQTAPTLAAGGPRPLLLWHDARDGGNAYGALLPLSGPPTASEFRIGASRPWLSAAWDGARYLTILTPSSMSGVRVSATGVVDPAFIPLTVAYAPPRVACGATDCLVALEQASDIVGMRIAHTAATAGAAFKLIGGEGVETGPALLAVRGGYLALAEDRSNIVAAEIAPSALASAPFIISASDRPESAPAAAAGDHETIAVYSSVSEGISRIAARRITFGADLGTACTTNEECHSNFCVDGRCCDTACGESRSADCQACSVAAGASEDGRCGVIGSGAHTCRAAASSCDVAETCDGLAAECPPDGFVADGSTCQDDNACNGIESCVKGSCVSAPPPDCDDLDDCTVDYCSADAGCGHARIPNCGGAAADAGSDAPAVDDSGLDARPPEEPYVNDVSGRACGCRNVGTGSPYGGTAVFVVALMLLGARRGFRGMDAAGWGVTRRMRR